MNLVDHEAITRAQLRLYPRSWRKRRRISLTPRTRREFQRLARWWELEARRGYPSSKMSLEYAANMRWAAETAGLLGDGTWLELRARVSAQAGEPKPCEVRYELDAPELDEEEGDRTS